MPDRPSSSDVTLAAIDIGTNSVHAVVARLLEDDSGPHFEVLEREKEAVRLGSTGGDIKELEQDAIERTVQALVRFAPVAARYDAPITAVATSAVREAENRHVLIDRAWEEAGIHIEVISGVEEARLIHLGVLQSVPVFDRRLVLCDIGGGSTELLVGERGEVLAARSFKLGAIRLTRQLLDEEPVTKEAVRACRRHVRSTLAPFAKEIRRLGPEVAVGSSGTISTLAEMAVARSTGSRPRSVRNLGLTRDDLGLVVEDLVAAPTAAERAQLAGLDPARADIILAGALILEQVMRELDLEELIVSDFALREGVLLDAWQRRRGGSLHHLSDLRRRSVEVLADAMDEDPAHARHVARLALALFDGTAPLHGVDSAARELLEAAALLSNVGLFLSHAQHHKHGYYVIRNTDRLTGFTDHEVELIALVVRYHRKSEPKAKHPEFAALDEADQELVRVLAGLLRVAIGLDRTHSAVVTDVDVRIDDGGVTIDLDPAPGADTGLERYAASTRCGLLEQVLGVPVTISGPEA
ncbi:MAG TPA: Ppx/GppA phosphatase family protein [Acidimicrobiales bacterium]|nr:Ppx/GppA phosphatase family protein [Acidimicrobiales bacterium]